MLITFTIESSPRKSAKRGSAATAGNSDETAKNTKKSARSCHLGHDVRAALGCPVGAIRGADAASSTRRGMRR